MKKIFKYSYVAVAALIAFVAAACTDSYDYSPATASGEQVYFSNSLPSTIEVSKSESSLQIPVNRVNRSGAITVPITVKKGDGSFLNYPSEVSFNDGDSVAYINATYNPDDVIYGTYIKDTISIGDEQYTTPYGASIYGFAAGATEWADFSNANSTGSYREDMLTTWYGVANEVYDVKIQRSVVNEGMYRLVNPYSGNYVNNEDGDYDTDVEHYWVIDATDPNYVYFKQYDSEMHWSYGYFHMTSYVQYYLDGGNTLDQIKQARPDLFGKLENGIITMPARSMLEWMDDYNDGGKYYGNTNGKLAVALPGYTIADYSASASYSGRYTDTDNKDYGEVTLTFGSDVASTKSALVKADDWNSNQENILTGIQNGSIESVESTSAGNVRLPYTDTGKYVIVVTIYDAQGNYQGYYVSDVINLRNSSDSEEKFNEIAAGNFSLGVKDVSSVISQDHSAWGTFPEALGLTAPVVQEAVLSQSQSDATHFKITPFWQDGYDLEFTVQADGSIVVDNVDTGIKAQSGNIKVNDIASVVGLDFQRSKSYGLASYVDGNTYYFTLLYSVDGGGYYGAETETFEVTATAAKALNTAKKVAARHKSSKTINAGYHAKKNFGNKKLFKGGSAFLVK